MNQLENFKFRGARAMILLHEQHQREFLEVWREAKRTGVQLPQVEDPDYQSLEHLLRHVLRSARGYMTWMCEVLRLPNPEIDPTPEADEIEAKAEAYLNHVLDRWRSPLAEIRGKAFEPSYKSRWGMDYSIESMLEHALVHPMRHTFQLKEFMKTKN